MSNKDTDSRMGAPTGADFDQEVQEYEEYLHSPLGWLQVELVWRQLEPQLGSRTLEVLEAGGPGSFALRLARQGHQVTLIEESPALIARAQRAAVGEPADVTERITYRVADLNTLSRSLGDQRFDLIICHNVLEYSTDSAALLKSLVGLLRPGGGLSLLAANRANEPLKAAIVGHDLPAAAGLLEAASPRTQAATLERVFGMDELTSMFANAGVTLLNALPIRVVADYLPQALMEHEDGRRQLLELETRLSTRPEYRDIGRMIWCWGTRDMQPGE